MTERCDTVVVGAGPNGLAAAATLARAGRRVLVLEANDTVGGGARSAELTLPGFVHDVCSAVHPLGASSPVFRGLDLAAHGLEWLHPEVPLAHPLDDGSAAVLRADLEETAAGLGADGAAWRRVFGPLARRWPDLVHDLLGPVPRVPRAPLALVRFGLRALRPAAGLARSLFDGPHARALFGGVAGHAIQPLERPLTSALALPLVVSGHAVGWPVARGGSQAIVDALAAVVTAHGGRIETGRPVGSLRELPAGVPALLDVTPRQLVTLAGDTLRIGRRHRLRRWRYGPGVCKVDYALSGPVPWRNPDCDGAGTVHVGGSLDEIAAAEREVAAGAHAERPFVIVAQQDAADPTRAPRGQRTLWAYCHVPNGSDRDVSDTIDAQIERFAPGFRDRVLARHVRTAARAEDDDANLVGGDIAGGANDVRQLVDRACWPGGYRTPLPGVYLCSAATAPGAGVHGMCGYHAARMLLRDQARGRV